MLTSRMEKALLFDKQDHELLRIVNDVLERGPYAEWKKILTPYLHPNGIKEMASTFGLRTAYAVVNVFGSLETGKASDRLEALRSLRDEILTAPRSSLRYNTSRVLLQIMKELVRSKGDEMKQLQLAHDFRRSISGKPRIIRSQLENYHLLEMTEDYTHIAFDDHVHDAYSKGRKTPSHLIMDAWIKGLRKIHLIYYNYISPNVAWEVLQAAEIMKISVRISIELRARRLGRYVKLIWTPRGLSEPEEFAGFLKTPSVQEFMRKGREVSSYQQQYVWALVAKYNRELRFKIAEAENVDAPELELEAFAAFLGPGQASADQLANYLSQHLSPRNGERLDSEELLCRWLAPEANPDIVNPFLPSMDREVPELLQLDTAELVSLLGDIHYNNWITLDPEGLDSADMVLEIFACRGAVTHLEVFNLRAYAKGQTKVHEHVLELWEVLTAGNAIRCKRYLNKLIDELRATGSPENQEKIALLTALLDQLPDFYRLYAKRKLRLRVGTDSTGKAAYRHGMGIVIPATLPYRARRHLRRNKEGHYMALPLTIDVMHQATYQPRLSHPGLSSFLQNIPGGCWLAFDSVQCWIKGKFHLAQNDKDCLYTLGGKISQVASENGHKPPECPCGPIWHWKYLNSRVQNGLKILLGLLPAAISFYLTKDWWLLAWFGALIWFTITGVRNIIQSVLGGGGFRRSRMLKWKDFVSWNRFSDSLLFTGFSVPLLDWLVKSVVLNQGFGVNTTTSPMLLYSIMALVNGSYISGHNILRGFPRSAIVGNFFRSVLSIPIALFVNLALGWVLALNGVSNIEAILQMWAAIISKLSSDTVAGVIEGLADRANFIAIRRRDIEQKMKQLFDTHAQLEMLYPQDDVLELLEMPKAFIETISTEQKGLEQIVIVNALDFMYFWLCQPRGRSVMISILRGMTPDERKIFLLSQYVLHREKEISLLLVNGLVGKRFNSALAFYLDNVESYLYQLQRAAARF